MTNTTYEDKTLFIQSISVLLLFNKREITEFEWYLRDHLFRQSNQGREKFQKGQLAKEMSSLCLRTEHPI